MQCCLFARSCGCGDRPLAARLRDAIFDFRKDPLCVFRGPTIRLAKEWRNFKAFGQFVCWIPGRITSFLRRNQICKLFRFFEGQFSSQV